LKTLSQQLADKQQECAQLHPEKARLIALLEKHGTWQANHRCRSGWLALPGV